MSTASRPWLDQLDLRIRRVRITWRLLGMVLSLLIILLIIISWQWFLSRQQLDYLFHLKNERLLVDRLIQQAALDIASSQVALVDYIAGREPGPQVVDSYTQSANNKLTEAKVLTTDETRWQQLSELLKQVSRYSESVGKLQNAKLAGNGDDVARYSEEAQRLGDGVRMEAHRLVQASAEQMDDDLERALLGFEQRSLLAALVFLLTFTLLAVAGYLVARSVIRPIREIQQAAQSMERGQWEHVLPAAAADELGDLARSFNQMARAIHQAQAEQQTWGRQLEEKVRLRTQELGQLVAQQEQLLATVRATSAPVVPVLDRIIILPLVGVVDSPRAQHVLETLLRGIEAHRAQVALVDITGVPVVDAAVAQLLLQAAAAARLLGAQVVLVGIRPEVARTIVGLGLDLSQIVTRADLQSGVEYAWRITRRGSRLNADMGIPGGAENL